MELQRASRGPDGIPAVYRLRRVHLRSLGKFGCLLGGLIGCLSSPIVAWGGLLLLRSLRRVLEAWQQVGIHVLGQEIPIDLVSLLNLQPLLHTVQRIDSLSWALAVFFVAAASLVAGFVFSVLGYLLGGLYNVVARLSGGLEVELGEVPSRERGNR